MSDPIFTGDLQTLLEAYALTDNGAVVFRNIIDDDIRRFNDGRLQTNISSNPSLDFGSYVVGDNYGALKGQDTGRFLISVDPSQSEGAKGNPYSVRFRADFIQYGLDVLAGRQPSASSFGTALYNGRTYREFSKGNPIDPLAIIQHEFGHTIFDNAPGGDRLTITKSFFKSSPKAGSDSIIDNVVEEARASIYQEGSVRILNKLPGREIYNNQLENGTRFSIHIPSGKVVSGVGPFTYNYTSKDFEDSITGAKVKPYSILNPKKYGY